MKKLFLFSVLLILAAPVFAVVAKPGSGVYGDEFRHYRLNAQGQIVDLVEKSIEHQSSISKRKASQEIGLEPSFPVKGDVPCLVLLVEYTDVKFRIANPQSAFSRMLNEEGYHDMGAKGSARDYFVSSSAGQFRPHFDVFGPIMVDSVRAYYGGNGDANVKDMVLEACINFTDTMDERDWVKYDSNNDGQIDNVFIIYAGANEAEGGPSESVWPHRSYALYDGGTIYRIGGKYLWDYACTSELKGDGTFPMMSSIGTFCHEFSHVMGLADLYNTKNSSAYTVGEWDIMCAGNYNNDGLTPPAYSAFERWMMGWITPTQLTAKQTYYLAPLETDNTAYLIAETTHNLNVKDPSPCEYWLIENRQRVGWDSPKGCIAGEGLLISHINYDANKWLYNTGNNSKPLLYDICEANNKIPLYATAADTYPGSGNITYFVPRASSGQNIDSLQLINIRTIGEQDIAFAFCEEEEIKSTSFRVVRVGNQWTVLLPEYAGENEWVYVYDTRGNLIQCNEIPEGENIVPLNTGGFIKGNIYVVKHLQGKKVERNKHWAKFIY